MLSTAHSEYIKPVINDVVGTTKEAIKNRHENADKRRERKEQEKERKQKEKEAKEKEKQKKKDEKQAKAEKKAFTKYLDDVIKKEAVTLVKSSDYVEYQAGLALNQSISSTIVRASVSLAASKSYFRQSHKGESDIAKVKKAKQD